MSTGIHNDAVRDGLGPWGPRDPGETPPSRPWGATPGTAGPASGLPPAGPAAAAPPAPAPARLRLGWSGTHGLTGLSVLNLLLKIATLGIYGFWGRTEIRRRVWSAIRLDGEPLEYTGHGRELLLGFLVVFGIVMLPTIAVTLAATLFAGPAVGGAVQVATYIVFALLYGIGTYRAQRYRLSRTRWRGIRMRLAGSSWTYGWTYLWTLALLPLTLGWIAPWRTTLLQRLLTRDTSFGDRPFRFTASSGPLYARYTILWLGTAMIAAGALAVIGRQAMALTQGGRLAPLAEADKMRLGVTVVVTLAIAYLLYGVVAAWYRAKVINHFAAHTHFETARLVGTASAAGLVWLAVSNALIVIGTVGILAPVAQARATRYLVDHLTIAGDIDLAAIRQAPDDGETRGEGLAQAFDIDAF